MINKLLEAFTKLQNRLYKLTESGIDVQKIQTALLIIMCAVQAVYSIIFLLKFQWNDLVVSFSLCLLLFYYALAMNDVLNSDE